MLTNESFTPLQKAMHIMKKGYEVQKKSVSYITEQSPFLTLKFVLTKITIQVIEHLDKYLVDP